MAGSVKIEVNVPSGGLNHYAFLGLGYVHNEIVPDRRINWPVSRGIPLPEGAVENVRSLALKDAKGNLVPRQVRPLATWPDGSVMFAHLAWQCDVAHDEPAHFTLELSGGESSPQPNRPVKVKRGSGMVEIENGRLRAVISREANAPALSLELDGKLIFDDTLEIWTTDINGIEHRGTLTGPESISVIENGPVVAVVEIKGRHFSKRNTAFLDYVLRFRLDAERPVLLLSHQFINMGDEPEGVAVGEIGLRLPEFSGERVTREVVRSLSGSDDFNGYVELQGKADVSISSSGMKIAETAELHVDTSKMPSYLAKAINIVDQWIGIRSRYWSAVTFIREAIENHPKRLVSDGNRMEYHIWPKGAEVQNLRQGMARTHHIELVFFDESAVTGEFHRYFEQTKVPANVVVPFEWYQECKVFGMENTLPWMPKEYPLVEGTFVTTIERGWATGMLNYGDDPDSGYSASYSNLGVTQQTVWINNEHDFTSQAMIQYWRTGRPKALRSARVCAEHQIDVDFVRKSDDEWKVGGIPAHCHLHTTSAVYPSHTWTEGLLQYYLTSGDDRALEVAKSLGRNLCKYVEERYVVLETESRMEGWALIALDALIEVTRDEQCLKAAKKIESKIREIVERLGGYDCASMGYGTGTVLTGLANLHRITGDQNTLKLLRQIIDWHLENSITDFGTLADEHPYNLNLTLPGLAYVYNMTGDKKYLDAGIDYFLFSALIQDTISVRSTSKFYRTFMPYLKVAHEAGALKEVEKRMQ